MQATFAFTATAVVTEVAAEVAETIVAAAIQHFGFPGKSNNGNKGFTKY
ncbi:MAG UNVERIFIED_CONTAM: hypothetical protein LVQ98_03210 [Rickettsiaceae bacterium]